MPREKKGTAPATQPTVDLVRFTRRQRLLQVVVALKGTERDLADLWAELEPRSRNAEALIREAGDQVTRARKSLEDYQDELEVWA